MEIVLPQSPTSPPRYQTLPLPPWRAPRTLREDPFSNDSKVPSAPIREIRGPIPPGGPQQPHRFGSDSGWPFDLPVAVRWVPRHAANPHRPDELVRALGLAANHDLDFRRHYCLGAIR
jgi:hypothetical protein